MQATSKDFTQICVLVSSVDWALTNCNPCMEHAEQTDGRFSWSEAQRITCAVFVRHGTQTPCPFPCVHWQSSHANGQNQPKVLSGRMPVFFKPSSVRREILRTRGKLFTLRRMMCSQKRNESSAFWFYFSKRLNLLLWVEPLLKETVHFFAIPTDNINCWLHVGNIPHAHLWFFFRPSGVLSRDGLMESCSVVVVVTSLDQTPPPDTPPDMT